MERALTREQFDFVQLTYNFADRRAEERLLPLAIERGTAVIVNRAAPVFISADLTPTP